MPLTLHCKGRGTDVSEVLQFGGNGVGPFRKVKFWLAKTASVSATLETCWLIGTWQLRVVFLTRETQR